jgi:hypothetical protein
MVTQTTEEAMDLLEEYRAGQLADARDVACELIEHFGFTTVRQVQEVMAERDLIDRTLGNYWIGAIFRTPQFEPTGGWEIPKPGMKRTTGNKAHAWRPIMIWRFSKPTNSGFSEQFWGRDHPRKRSDVRKSAPVVPMRIRQRRKR